MILLYYHLSLVVHILEPVLKFDSSKRITLLYTYIYIYSYSSNPILYQVDYTKTTFQQKKT